MLHLMKAITQIKKEIRDLEAGKLSIDALILEKMTTMKGLQLTLLEVAHEEAGNSKTKFIEET